MSDTKEKITAFLPSKSSIPGFKVILKILRERSGDKTAATVSPEVAKLNKTSIKLIEDLKLCVQLCSDFVTMFPAWAEERSKCMDNMKTIADKIDHHHRNVNVVQLPAAGLGILSGVLVITGLALTPVTFGASLGLTIAGTVVGVASAGTGGGASVTDMVITKRRVKEAHTCFEEHKITTVALIKIISGIVQMTEEINQLYSEETVHYLEKVVSNSEGALKKAAAMGVVSNSKSVFSLISSIPDAVSALKHLAVIVTSSPILHSVLSLVPAQISSAIATVSTQAAALLGGQTLVAFSYIGGAVGIVMSTGVAAFTIYDMVKKENKTDAANKLRLLREQLDKEYTEIEKLHSAVQYAMGEENDQTEEQQKNDQTEEQQKNDQTEEQQKNDQTEEQQKTATG